MCTNILALSTFSISEQASLSFLSLHMIFLTAYWGKKKILSLSLEMKHPTLLLLTEPFGSCLHSESFSVEVGRAGCVDG